MFIPCPGGNISKSLNHNSAKNHTAQDANFYKKNIIILHAFSVQGAVHHGPSEAKGKDNITHTGQPKFWLHEISLAYNRCAPECSFISVISYTGAHFQLQIYCSHPTHITPLPLIYTDVYHFRHNTLQILRISMRL